jgi:hypothetical protein
MPDLLTTYVAEVFTNKTMGGSQSMNVDEVRCMQLAKKCPKVVIGAISSFFGNKTRYKTR